MSKFNGGYRMVNAFQVAEGVVGRTIDMDGAYGGQCADLAQYVGKYFGKTLMGNGNQIGTIGNVSSVADVIPYTKGMRLRTGDIISLGDTTGRNPYGHVVVYGEGALTNALVIDQNYNYVQVVQKHRYNLLAGMIPLRIVRFRNQSNYTPMDGSGTLNGNPSLDGVNAKTLTFYEITCDKVQGIKGNGDNTVFDTFYKCNKVTGNINGDWLIYDRYTGGKGYIPKACVKERTDFNKTKEAHKTNTDSVNGYTRFSDKTSDGAKQTNTQAIYSLDQFIRDGRIKWGGYEWTYYSQRVLPGGGLNIPGRHVNAYGYVSDKDGYIVLASPSAWGNVKGNVYNTPFGFKGKVYDVNAGGTSLDVYIR